MKTADTGHVHRKTERRSEKDRRVNPYIHSIPDLRDKKRRRTVDRRKAL